METFLFICLFTHKTTIFIIQLYFINALLPPESFGGQLAILFMEAMSQNIMLSGSVHICYSKSTGIAKYQNTYIFTKIIKS